MNNNEEFEEFIKNNKSNLSEALKETMIIFMKDTRQKYPKSLTVSDLSEITNYSENSIYKLLKQGKIPYAKKLKGWRVPRETFILWWYGSYFEEDIA